MNASARVRLQQLGVTADRLPLPLERIGDVLRTRS